MAADAGGHLFVVSALPIAGQQQTRVVKLDLGGIRLASLDIGQIASPQAVATDPQGNVIVAGQDSSYQGRVVKIDGQLHTTVFSMSLPASINAAAVDASGNIYVTGSTSSAVFPVTPGAYQSKPPGSSPLAPDAPAVYAFFTEISADGSKLLYSTYFGDDAVSCISASSCVGAYAWTAATAIALDSSGGVVIAGYTDATNLPTTPGAVAAYCACQYHLRTAGFIARFQPGAAQQLQSSTFLNTSQPNATVNVSALALDAAGNAIVGGGGSTLPTTPGTVEPTPIAVPGAGDGGGFLIKLNRSATAVVWGTYFGSSAFSSVRAIYVDAQGRVLFTGSSVTPPVSASPPLSSFVSSYVARLTSDGATLTDYFSGPSGLVGQGLAMQPTGAFAAVGYSGGLWIEGAASGPSLLAGQNSAGGASLTTVAPYELISLYGLTIGPPVPVGGQVVNGAFTTSLSGYQVLFDGAAAPLLYAGAGQINAVVPSGVSGKASTKVQIVTPQGTVDGPTMFVASVEPSVFVNSQTGLAAAVNQDGTVNSASNPAKPGSIVTVFVSGGGSGYYSDGALVPLGIFSSYEEVLGISGLLSLEVEFAGAAPGMVAGVVQINFRVPSSLQPGSTFAFSFQIGNVPTGTVQIAVAP